MALSETSQAIEQVFSQSNSKLCYSQLQTNNDQTQISQFFKLSPIGRSINGALQRKNSQLKLQPRTDSSNNSLVESLMTERSRHKGQFYSENIVDFINYILKFHCPHLKHQISSFSIDKCINKYEQLSSLQKICEILNNQTQRPCFLTRGEHFQKKYENTIIILEDENGLLVVDELPTTYSEGCMFLPELSRKHNFGNKIIKINSRTDCSIVFQTFGQKGLKRILIFKKQKQFGHYQLFEGNFDVSRRLSALVQLKKDQEYLVYTTQIEQQSLNIYSKDELQIVQIPRQLNLEYKILSSLASKTIPSTPIFFQRTLLVKVGLIIQYHCNNTNSQVKFQQLNTENQEKRLLFQNLYNYNDSSHIIKAKTQIIRIFEFTQAPAHIVTPKVRIHIAGKEYDTNNREQWQIESKTTPLR